MYEHRAPKEGGVVDDNATNITPDLRSMDLRSYVSEETSECPEVTVSRSTETIDSIYTVLNHKHIYNIGHSTYIVLISLRLFNVAYFMYFNHSTS
jgi:hypothetical protein